jgi:hypothetical protein
VSELRRSLSIALVCLLGVSGLMMLSAPGIAQDDDDDDAEVEVEVIETEVPVATATPSSDPSLVLAGGVGRLPVRTGPYLGASLSTIALRQAATADDDVDTQPRYPVFAKSRDETDDVFWYLTEVNGTRGWVSGRLVNVDFDGDGTADATPDTPAIALTGEGLIVDAETGETISAQPRSYFDRVPYAGSIFDELDDAPDVGVSGLLLRDRTLHRRPSRRAAVIGELPAGTSVSILNRTREITVDDWYQVRIGAVVGWVESESNAEPPSVEVNRDRIRERVPVR